MGKRGGDREPAVSVDISFRPGGRAADSRAATAGTDFEAADHRNHRPGGALRLDLDGAHQTKLQLSAEIRETTPERGESRYPRFQESESQPDSGPLRFLAVFHRLGPTTAPATVHYTTRDVSATASKDYVAQSGTITFAPLETEKMIQIPILIDTEDEFDETLEVVVTGADGFEVPKTPSDVEGLPAPMRLTILGKGSAPRLERAKRLRDGRVLLGGSHRVDGTEGIIEFSSDLKTWHPLTNLLGGFNGESTLWLDASATNAATRYYRAVAR